MRQRIAVVGSGVSGLVAARDLHATDHDVTLYEADTRLGGHAHTITVNEDDQELALDTGFVVFNETNYPQFTALLRELNVASQPSDMSFGVKCNHCRLEYSSHGLPGLFAQRSQLLRPCVYKMAVDILRFNAWGRRQISTHSESLQTTIGDLRNSQTFGDYFFRHYLIPMTSAIWSSTASDSERFPLPLFLQFFANHGLLQIHGHPPWRTVIGGSQRYIDALVRPFQKCIRLRTTVDCIQRNDGGVKIHTADNGWECYDKVVIATHADHALNLLETPTQEETDSLGIIPYRKNIAVLHTDRMVLPRSPRAWASWNYDIGNCFNSRTPLRMTYYLNRLQRLDAKKHYCVTLNAEELIDPAHILATVPYEHPVYTEAGLHARDVIRSISGQNHTFYCGAHLGNGFHEDGVVSGLAIRRTLDQMQEAA